MSGKYVCEVSRVVGENYLGAKIWVQINVYEYLPMKYCSHKTRITRTWKNTFLSRYSSYFRRFHLPLQFMQDDMCTTVGYLGGRRDWGSNSEVRDDMRYE